MKYPKRKKWTEAELARFARAWRKVKVTDECCPLCHYPIVEVHGWLKSKEEEALGEQAPADKSGYRKINITPDACCACHCVRQSLTVQEAARGRSWLRRSVKI